MKRTVLTAMLKANVLNAKKGTLRSKAVAFSAKMVARLAKITVKALVTKRLNRAKKVLFFSQLLQEMLSSAVLNALLAALDA